MQKRNPFKIARQALFLLWMAVVGMFVSFIFFVLPILLLVAGENPWVAFAPWWFTVILAAAMILIYWIAIKWYYAEQRWKEKNRA